MTSRSAPAVSLVQGDFCPKNILIDDGMIAGVIDWEFAGAASPAYDLAQWEVDAGAPLHDRLDLLLRG
ncbi:MAG TPA: phosphotransferase [Microlunatus sp.]